jgi:diguanylate cyclase (GGDEF)-like protein
MSEKGQAMINPIRKLIHRALTMAALGYKIVRGIDYRTLSLYVLKINEQKDMDSILLEVSKCLKDILDYELFGFVLKNGNATDVWIDPRVYTSPFVDYVAEDIGGQKIDFKLHYFDKKIVEICHNVDAIDINSLISYKVLDNQYVSKLYILPKRMMMAHHDSIVSTIISSISITLEKNLNIKQLENAAAIDPLTNCYNRRALSGFIESDIAFAQRHRSELSVIMVDLDDFKEINDVYGHLAGDEVLRSVSSVLHESVRKSDYLARFGGEEFMLVLPDTSLYNAVQLAHKIRKRISELTVHINGKTISTTASFGVAGLENKEDHASLFLEADERLYKAKSIGKNNVVPSMMPCFADRYFVSPGSTRTLADAAQVA